MSYVITCGDEGIQLNQGTRLAVVGAGFRLENFSKVVTALKKIFGEDIAIVSNDESDWTKRLLNLTDWEQVNASMEQHIEAVADREKLHYAGHLTFSDPKVLKFDIKGHLVRPHGIHIANKICFTLAGGEQTYNLGKYLISAEWLSEVPFKIAQSVIQEQVAFYESLTKKKLAIVFEREGELGEKIAEKNQKVLEKMGLTESVSA